MCGFVHSTFFTTPVTLTGLVASYSAASEWWARRGTATTTVAAPATSAATNEFRDMTVLLLPQREREEGAARIPRDVLPPADRVGDRSGLDLTADRKFPEQRTRTRVEREEVSFATAAEQQIRSSRQDAGVGEVGHLELPLSVARQRIDCAHRAVAFVFFAIVVRRGS